MTSKFTEKQAEEFKKELNKIKSNREAVKAKINFILTCIFLIGIIGIVISIWFFKIIPIGGKILITSIILVAYVFMFEGGLDKCT